MKIIDRGNLVILVNQSKTILVVGVDISSVSMWYAGCHNASQLVLLKPRAYIPPKGIQQKGVFVSSCPPNKNESKILLVDGNFTRIFTFFATICWFLYYLYQGGSTLVEPEHSLFRFYVPILNGAKITSL